MYEGIKIINDIEKDLFRGWYWDKVDKCLLFWVENNGWIGSVVCFEK